MGDFNKVMILGRLTRDPEVRYIPNGSAVCDISLATNRRIPAGEGQWKDETTFIDVTLWRRQAELAGQYLGKGRELFVEGYLSMDTWEDRNTGQKRSKLKVVCDNMQFVGGNAGGGGNPGGGQQQAAPQQQYQQQAPAAQQSAPAAAPQFENDGYQQAAPQQQSAPQQPAFEPDEDDDIPF